MRPLTRRQQEDILTLAEFYEQSGAANGLRITHSQTAAALGWHWMRVCNTVRLIKEHPELRMGISIRRGPDPVVTFTTEANLLVGDAVIAADAVGRAGYLETILRLARYAMAVKVQHRNTADKRSAASRRLLAEFRRQKAAIASLQASLDLQSTFEEEVAEFLEEVLA